MLLLLVCSCTATGKYIARRVTIFTLQELLEFVAHYHMLLDPINLVTCLYRLAKMSKEASRGRGGYLNELQKHPTFQLLLRKLLLTAWLDE